MRRGGVLGASLFAIATMLAVPGIAQADEAKIAFLKEKLVERADERNDIKVRTSAALALGATNEDGAGEPLCGALSDSKEVVRQAAAVALKRLNRPATLPCLRAHGASEKSEVVKVAIQRAIEALGAGGDGGGSDPIRENPSAKYYISLSSIANATGRPQTDVERIVLASMRKKLDASGSMQLAPGAETPDKARSVMKSRGMKGFYLAIAIDRFDYSEGNLRVKLKVGVFNYPNKSLLGNIDKSLTAQGISSGDTATEDRLLELAAGMVSEQFAQNASAFL